MGSESDYLSVLTKVLEHGEIRADRTGTGVISLFGEQMRFNIKNSVPLLTTKFVSWKTVIHELLWFLSGKTDSKWLQDKGVVIWEGNTSREFLDKRGLYHLPEGDIGAGYGFQWRHSGADYVNCHTDYTGKGIDQIQTIIDQLKNDKYSRRIFLSAWNPSALSQTALPPCHVSCQFYVTNGNELKCHMYQRSVDMFLGSPYNIFSYTVLTYILAAICDLTPSELIISTGDTHIYANHVEQVKTQLERKPFDAPSLVVNPDIKSKRLCDITIDDFKVENYIYHPSIKAPMAI